MHCLEIIKQMNDDPEGFQERSLKKESHIKY